MRRIIAICIIVGLAIVIGIVALVGNLNKSATENNTTLYSRYDYGVTVDEQTEKITDFFMYGSKPPVIKEGEAYYRFTLFTDEFVDYGISQLSTMLKSDVVIDGVTYSSSADLNVAVDYKNLIEYYNRNLVGTFDFAMFGNLEWKQSSGNDPITFTSRVLEAKLYKALDTGDIPPAQIVSLGIGQTAFVEGIATDYDAGLSAEQAYMTSLDREKVPGGCPAGQHATHEASEGTGTTVIETIYVCVDEASVPFGIPPHQVIEYDFVCSTVTLGVKNENAIAEATYVALDVQNAQGIWVSSPDRLKTVTDKPCGFNVYDLQPAQESYTDTDVDPLGFGQED